MAKRSLYLLLTLLVSAITTQAADEDPLQDLCVADLTAKPSANGFPCKTEPKAEDFAFTGLRTSAVLNAAGFNASAVSVSQFPGLNTNGISANRVTLAPGGINSPHIHPRATELILILKGTVEAGFVTTGNKLFSQTLSAGDIFVFPRALLHYQSNVGKSNAVIYATFNSQNPGTQRFPAALFGSGLGTELLKKTFGLDAQIIEELKKKFTP